MRREWNHDHSLDWHLADQPLHAGLSRFLADLGVLYRERSELWRADPDPEGYAWLDADDRDHSIYAYIRRDGERTSLVVLNLTPVPRHDYRVGAPLAGRYRLALSSDDTRYGGSGFGVVSAVQTEEHAWQGHPHSFGIGLPPLGAIVLTHEPG
jgi:1,4-alpha-glucan branching enzyme